MSFEIIVPFLRPIQSLLESVSISEIMVNPDGTVWVEESGHIQRVPNIHFGQGSLLTALEVIANRFGKKLDPDSPIMNLRLPDGSRLAAVIPPVVNPEPMMTIRKHTSSRFLLCMGRPRLWGFRLQGAIDTSCITKMQRRLRRSKI